MKYRETRLLNGQSAEPRVERSGFETSMFSNKTFYFHSAFNTAVYMGTIASHQGGIVFNST